MADILERWAVTMVSGGKPVTFPGHLSFPAVSSLDGKYSIVVLAHQLRVYFLQTRQCIRTVDLNVANAVAVWLDPGNGNQLVIFLPSTILYVNWKEKVSQPVVARQVISPLQKLTEVFAVSEKAYYAITNLDSVLSIVKIDREHATVTNLFSTPHVLNYAVSSRGSKLAVVSDLSTVLLFDLSSIYTDMVEPQAAIDATVEKYTALTKISCMAVSDDGIVALGTTTGVIHLIYGGTNSSLPTKLLRWHIDPVRCLAFSHDHTYLVSGGNEKVLVFWHLDLDRPQFLPRLSGPIDRIHVDANRPDHYSVALLVDEPTYSLNSMSKPSHEIVTILAVDLISRLSVSPIRPNFANGVETRTRKKHQKAMYDITAPVSVHPTTRHLYFAKGPSIQAFDVVRGEQAFVQHAAPQISTGRVKSEHNVADPTVTMVSFTPDGNWMATFDSMPTLDFDNLLLKNDTAYALKFWRQTEAGWNLALKIVDPHGVGLDVGAIFPSPDSSFTTLDVKGGVRLWRVKVSTAAKADSNPEIAEWTLRRSSAPTTKSSIVSGCYSPDGSLLVVAHGCALRALHPNTLQPIAFNLPSSELPIEKVDIIGSHLVVVSQSRLVSFDLVRGTETELSARISTSGAGNVVAVDGARQLIAVATNTLPSVNSTKSKGRLTVLKPDSLKPTYSVAHSLGIASVTNTSSGFVFVDSESRVGLLAPQTKSNLADTEDLTAQMEKIMVSAQAAANVLYSRSAEEKLQKEDVSDEIEKWTSHKLVDTAVLLPIFANVEGISMDTLFEKIVRAVQ